MIDHKNHYARYCELISLAASSAPARQRDGGYMAAVYILPADKQATVKTGATTIVEMHNEFRDTPKTGDDFNLGLWVSLAAASVIGAGVLGFVGFKKKKKED